MAMYDPVTDSFTYYTPIKHKKVEYNDPLNGLTDISNWASRITSDGIPIVSANTPQAAQEEERDIFKELGKSHVENPVTSIPSSTYNTKNPKKAVQVMNKLMQLDSSLTPEQAAGIVGQIDIESSLNFGNSNPNDLGKSSKGAIQWNQDRFNSLKEFAKSKSKPWTDEDIQLEFLVKELQSKYSQNYNQLKQSSTPDQAAEALSGYVRYAGYDGTLKSAQTLQKTKKWSNEQTIAHINKEKQNRRNSAINIYNLWKQQS